MIYGIVLGEIDVARNLDGQIPSAGSGVLPLLLDPLPRSTVELLRQYGSPSMVLHASLGTVHGFRSGGSVTYLRTQG
jgi:hypothetical protein